MIRQGPSLPITNDWRATVKRWGAELRKLPYLITSDFVEKGDWSPNVLTPHLNTLAAGTMTFANIRVVGARYWAPYDGDICFINAEINFDITANSDPYIGVALPLDPVVGTAGQHIFAYTLFGIATAERRVVPATITNGIMFVPRQEDIAVNPWAVGTNNYIIVSGHYKIDRN